MALTKTPPLLKINWRKAGRMTGLFKRIYRQRRRLGFAAFFHALSGLLLIGGETIPKGVPIWMTALGDLIFVAILTALSVVVLVVLPRWRTVIEIAAIYVFLFSALSKLWPDIFGLYTSPIGTILQFVLIMAISNGLYGTWSDRLRLWVKTSDRYSFTTTRPRAEIWEALIPGKAAPEEFWDGLLANVEPEEDEADSLRLCYHLGNSAFEHQRITILEETPLERCKYYHIGDVSARNSDFSEGIWDIKFTETKSGATRVSLHWTRTAMHPRLGVLNWFDDRVGDMTDSMKARLSGVRDFSMHGLFVRDALKMS